LLSPFVAIGLLEALLRLAGFGGYPPTVRAIGKSGQATMLVTDNRGTSSYFDARRTRPGTLNPTAFASPKPPDTVRIVLAGESAIEGFPQPMGWTAGAFLQEMLGAVWPGRHVEVINLGTTAVASFAVADMLKEVLPYEVDLVVIYGGHNEYFGAYGVASAHRAGGGPGALRLRRALGSTALVQALERLGARGASTPSHTLMEDVVKESAIPANSPLRQAASHNLHAHVGDMITRSRQAGAAVVVCIPPVNESGMAPIGRSAVEEMEPAQRKPIEALLAEAADAANPNPAAAVEKLQAAAKLAPQDAGIQYRLGNALRASGAGGPAQAAYQLALNLDTMPWRLTPDGAAALRDVAQTRGAALCDVAEAFRAASPDGCIGWELLDDHVHPTLRGQWLLARTWVDALTHLEGRVHVDAAAAMQLPDFDSFVEGIHLNPYDRYTVVQQLVRVFGVPFMKASNPAAFTRLDAERARMFAGMSLLAQSEAERWENPATHAGIRVPLSGMVAQALAREGRFAEAEPLLAAARLHVPAFNGLQFEYTYLLLAFRKDANKSLTDDDQALARATIDHIKVFLELSDHSSGQPERYLGRLLQLLGEHQAAIPRLMAARPKLKGTDALAVDMALLEAYMSTNQQDLARELARRGAAAGGPYVDAYRHALEAIPSGAGTP
jgi:tetratricopeptide (TPR) repeat protein